MNLRHLVAAIFLAPFLQLLAAPAAQAAPQCAVTLSGISFGGNIDILAGGAIDGAGSATIACSNFGSGENAQAVVCLGLSDGANAAGGQRKMASASAMLSYELFSDSGRSARWGATQQSEPYFVLRASAPQLNVPIYARIAALQKTAPVGPYIDNVTPMAFIAAAANGAPSCNAMQRQVAATPFLVSAGISANCIVSASDMSFGPQSSLAADLYAISAISVTCTTNAPYWVALDGGAGAAADPAQRKLTGPMGGIAYGLYSDSGYQRPWGWTRDVNTVAGRGGAIPAKLSVFGRIKAQATPAPGVYSDTVTLSVNF